MRTSQKALEEVNALIEGIDNYEEQTGEKNPPVYISKELLVKIQQSLNRLEAIENAEPSEAIECLERVNVHLETELDKGIWDKQYRTIKQALLRAQKREMEQAVIDYLEMEYRW